MEQYDDDDDLDWDDELGEDLLEDEPPPIEPMKFEDEFVPAPDPPVALETPDYPEAFAGLGKLGDKVGY